MTNSRRRDLLFAAGALFIAPSAARTQPATKIYRIGFLAPRSRSTPSHPEVFYDAFVQGMRELGYVEGKNLTIEWRFADGNYERLPALAADLVNTNVEVIVAPATPPNLALQRATSTIPIVFISVGDPIKMGLVASLARPGSNITGLSNTTTDLGAKEIELLKILIPALSHAAVLTNPGNPALPPLLKNVQIAAQQLGVAILPVQARNPEDVERGFVTMRREHAQAVIVLADPFLIGQRSQTAQLAVKNRLPSMFQTREEVLAGGLMSYGANLSDIFRRGAVYVDKILKGAKPSELPVEQPTELELVVNLKTATALGLAIPKSILFRANKVIQWWAGQWTLLAVHGRPGLPSFQSMRACRLRLHPYIRTLVRPCGRCP